MGCLGVGHFHSPSIAPDRSADRLSKVGAAKSITSEVILSMIEKIGAFLPEIMPNKENSAEYDSAKPDPALVRYGVTMSVAFMLGWKRQ
jgi:hypothetical protein